MDNLRQLAIALSTYVVAQRRALHKIPELRWEEKKTLAHIRTEVEAKIELIESHGIAVEIREESAGGLVVDITPAGMEEQKRLLFRADIDALPIREETGLEFASQNNGVMHACGHDCHSAMLLGFYQTIAEGSIQLVHPLRLVWQRAEENPLTESGGARLVREGVAENVAAAFALHVHPDLESGNLGSCYGPLLGNSDRLGITIRCSGGHVAEPDKGVNALRVTQAIQNALDEFPLRVLGSNEPATLEPAIIHSGTSSNAIPSEAEMWFGVRTMLNPDMRDHYFRQLRQEIESAVGTFSETTVEFEEIHGHPALHNNTDSFEHVRRLLQQADQSIEWMKPILGGEDFAHYLNKVPGCFWFLGVRKIGGGTLHQPTFNPNENDLWRGVHFFMLLAANPLP